MEVNANVVAAEDMNYTIVINGAVWLAALTYYALFARKWFTGPKMTIDADNATPHSGSETQLEK